MSWLNLYDLKLAALLNSILFIGFSRPCFCEIAWFKEKLEHR